MSEMHYVSLDVHKKTISYCVLQADGKLVREGTIAANRVAVSEWRASLPKFWTAGMEATMFTSWLYDHIVSFGVPVKVAHSAMLKAIVAGKRKNDTVDARKIADLLRCDYFPECHMVCRELRDRRRVLRYRNLLVRQTVRMKNRVSALMMETGVQYKKKKLHQKRYFQELITELRSEMPQQVPELLELSCRSIEFLRGMDRHLIQALRSDPVIQERVERLITIPGVGPVVALTWVLEVGEISRFSSIKKAISYCGLCGAEVSSAGKQQRTPISKQRNKHLQCVLVEAAKLAPRFHPELALLYEREKLRSNRNPATLAVARKFVSYLFAVDRTRRPFQKEGPPARTEVWKAA
jgi:transposase